MTDSCHLRKCRNWQTSKTKDLVAFVPCGFKSHLPHLGFFRRTGEALSYIAAGVAEWQTRRLQVPVVARLCGFKSHLLHKKEAVKTASFFINYVPNEKRAVTKADVPTPLSQQLIFIL